MDISEQTIFYCKKHSKHVINFINVSPGNLQDLSCEECIIEQGQFKDFISIQTIQVCEDDHIFSNWPPIQGSQLLKEIKSTLKADCLTIDHLEQEFSSLIVEISNKLQEVKKKMIQSIISQNDYKQQLLKCYNEISGKEKLKEATKFKKQNFENQFEDLKSFISQLHGQKDQNTSSLIESLQKYKNSLISQSEISQPRQSIINQVEVFCQEIDLIIQKQQSRLQLQFQQNHKKMQINQLFGKYAFCNIEKSSEIQILENKNEEKISIKKDKSINGQVYFNYQLNQQKNYTFRFKCKDKAGDYFIIGLIEDNNLYQQLSCTYQGKLFENNTNGYGGKVIKGNHFYEIEKDSIVEMRIDIQNGQILYLDYPDYQNINQLNENCELYQNKNYFLAIEFFENGQNKYETCLDLIYFEEINK